MIAAVDQENTLAHPDGKLPWAGSMPTDVAYYRDKITDHTVVMGSGMFALFTNNTNSHAVLLSRRSREMLRLPEEVGLIHSPDEIADITPLEGEKEIFIIGGQMIYETALHIANRIYLTRIDHSFGVDPANVRFPDLDETIWKITDSEPHSKDNNNAYSYKFLVYEKM